MKYLLTTLNSKYIHTSLSVRCLYASVKDFFDVSYCEYTINDSMSYICSDIYKTGADVICFSAYIWNFSQTLTVCDNLKKANPDILIVLGGPEVTYTGAETINNYRFVDYVVSGEGEITIREMFGCLDSGRKPYDIAGIVFRDENGFVVENPPREPVRDLDELPFAYDADIDDYKNKLIYYETSRGCPFSCTYCLSCEKVKKSKKLLKFELADGLENRTIVSGIALHYDPATLVGKQVCFIANLAPRTVCGVESQGMILSAVDSDESLSLLTLDKKVAPGSRVG